MRIAWIYDAQFLLHDPGSVHLERAERLHRIRRALDEAGLLARLQALPFQAATPAQLAAVHDPAYVELVRMVSDAEFPFIGSTDTGICLHSYRVAALAAGGVLAACDAIMAGTVARAFCAVRPPGHHAEADRAMGFCLFNHVALAAEHLVRHHDLQRVAIVDIDAHHGNGTQHIFESRRDVFYVSLHERPESLAFPGTGYASETGCGAGLGYTLNIPLRRGCDERDYLAAVDRDVLPALASFDPQMLLISAGFDALAGETVANLSLAPDTYGPLTERLVALAQQHAHGRLLSVLEGGYHRADLGRAVVAHVRALGA
jgi:acetoin utilization deacetylase AcuC-like enzyme